MKVIFKIKVNRNIASDSDAFMHQHHRVVKCLLVLNLQYNLRSPLPPHALANGVAVSH